MVEELLGLNYNVILVVIMVEEKPMKQCLLCDVFDCFSGGLASG